MGSEGNADEEQIREVLFSVIESGSIASYVTSTWGFEFRRLGAGEPSVSAWNKPVCSRKEGILGGGSRALPLPCCRR